MKRPLLVALLTLATPLAAQSAPSADSATHALSAKHDRPFRKYFVGSTLFMLANAVPDNNPPEMLYLNVGYRLTAKDIVSLEFKTWKYGWPIGIPYGKSFEAEGEGFPGAIREYGVSLNYQRFIGTHLFAQVDVMPAWQTFLNEGGKKIDDGFQIFNTYSVGYRVNLFKGRFFVDPSIAITHRPYQSRMPDAFKRVDDRWSRFFYGSRDCISGIAFEERHERGSRGSFPA